MDQYNNTAISVRGRIKKQPNEPGACYIYWKRYKAAQRNRKSISGAAGAIKSILSKD